MNAVKDASPYNRLVIHRRMLNEALLMAAAIVEASQVSAQSMTVTRDDSGFWVVEMYFPTVEGLG